MPDEGLMRVLEGETCEFEIVRGKGRSRIVGIQQVFKKLMKYSEEIFTIFQEPVESFRMQSLI